jgi:DNA repair photolyase
MAGPLPGHRTSARGPVRHPCEHAFVRWTEQLIDAEPQATLPGYREPATVRHFDAPEALDTRFYEVRSKSVLNKVPAASKMPFRWTVNPYRGCSHACSYCFARPTHTFLGMDAGRDFEREIVVKVNAPEVLRAELARPSWRHEHVAMGTNTDPYQWVEGRYGLMRGIWEALRDAANPCSVLTKSPLLLRDLDLLQQIAAVAPVSAALSIPTIDDKAWRATEPHTPSPRSRFEAVRALNDAGIPTGILVAPLMPGINDEPAQVERILDAAAEAGATSVGGIGLHLRGEVRGVFMDWLRSQRPDLVPRYERLYERGAYLPKAEQERLGALLQERKPGRPPWRGPSWREAVAQAQREFARIDAGRDAGRAGRGGPGPGRDAPQPAAAAPQASLF